MPEPAHKRQLTSTVDATPLMTPITALGLSIRLSLFELGETSDWDIFRFGSLSRPGREAPNFFYADLFSEFWRNWTRKFFSLKSDKDFGCSSGICRPSATPFRPEKRTKTKFPEIGQLCPMSTMSDLRFCGENAWERRPISEEKCGLEIGRDCGQTTVARGGSGAKAPPLAARPEPGTGEGRDW